MLKDVAGYEQKKSGGEERQSAGEQIMPSELPAQQEAPRAKEEERDSACEQYQRSPFDCWFCNCLCAHRRFLFFSGALE